METLTGTLKKTKDVVRGTQLATAAFHADIKVRTLTQARLERDVHDKASQLEATKKRCTEMEQAAQADAVVMQERAGTHAEQRAQIAHMQRQIASMDGALRASAADIAAAEKKFDVAHRRLENADVARKRAEARRDSDAVAIRDAERMCARLEGELDRAEERAKHADRECGVLHNRLGEAEADLKRERARRVERTIRPSSRYFSRQHHLVPPHSFVPIAPSARVLMTSAVHHIVQQKNQSIELSTGCDGTRLIRSIWRQPLW